MNFKCIVCEKEILPEKQDFLWLRDDRIIERGMSGLHRACAQPATDENEMGTGVYNDVEQLRDLWCGRLTYNNDGEWLDNVESMVESLSKRAGIAFASVQPAKRRKKT